MVKTLPELERWLIDAQTIMAGLDHDDPRLPRAREQYQRRLSERAALLAAAEPWPTQRFAFEVRWAKQKGVLELRDVHDGSWLQIDANEAPDYWRREATDKARAARVRRAA